MILDALIFSVYRYILIPTVIGILKICRNFLPAKIQEMIRDRNHERFVPLESRPIWIHASSGEIEYGKSVIRAVKEAYPQVPVLVTYFSPSAKKLIQNFEGIALSLALPWDERKTVSKFLAHFNPRALLIARTDVWPELAYQAHKKEIPSLLFSATLSAHSSRKSWTSQRLSRWAFNHLSAIHCVSPLDELNFASLKIKTPVLVSGDTRYDQVAFRLKFPRAVKSELKPLSKDKIFIAGSTWPEDEEILLPALNSHFQNGNKLILAPHEVSEKRLLAIEKKLQGLGYSWIRYSQSTSWVDEKILLVDQIGCLQELYTWGKVAFIGGSFKDKVHSVMEALSAGLPVLVGPKFHNNREAEQYSRSLLKTDLFIVQVVNSSTEFSNKLSQFMQGSFADEIHAKIQTQQGATKRVIAWLTSH